MSLRKTIALAAILFFTTETKAQEQVNWINFEQLEEALQKQPKKVFVDFYADWCKYCRRMDRLAFRDSRVVELLNDDYYAVRMDIESTDTVMFGGKKYVNERARKVNSVHQIALLMASRKGKPFSLPAMVILDEHFEAQARYFQYLTAEQLLGVLTDRD
ncbi:MAG TPA: thioredoxin family protein [Cytophagales bacterium]|nr:thioredoxin family protein [Cytophagales bacterium]